MAPAVGAVAVAVTSAGTPTVTTAPGTGLVTATKAEEDCPTVTLTEADSEVVPAESVTRALIAKVPTAAGVHASVKGVAETTPREVAPAKNST
jgi:hypothetical protein